MVCTLGLKDVFLCKYKSLNIPTILQSKHVKAKRKVLVDSGATDNFISENLLKRMKIGKLPLKKPWYIWNIDGTHNKAGSIKEYVDLQVQVGTKKEEMQFLVTHIGEDELVLGYPWLAAFQPKIDWKQVVLDEDQQPLIIRTLGLKEELEAACISKAWTKAAQERAKEGEEIFICKMNKETIKWTSTSTEMAVKALPKEEKTWEQIVPKHYHKWQKVFLEEEAKQYPQHQPWDIAIDLVKDAPKVLDCKIYLLTLAEQGRLEEYIRENLEKGYIQPLHSQYSSPFFFVGKKDGKF